MRNFYHLSLARSENGMLYKKNSHDENIMKIKHAKIKEPNPLKTQKQGLKVIKNHAQLS